MKELRQPFLIFGIAYQMQGEPTDARLVRIHDGLMIAHYSKAWDPREVIADATHDARVMTGRVRLTSPLVALLTAFTLVLAIAHGAWAIRGPDIGPPTDRPGPVIPASAPSEHEVQASWSWWIGWAGYLEAGPFATRQACEDAKVRFPVRWLVSCVPVRD